MVRSASFGVLQLIIAFSMSYALTGSVTIAGAITLLEPRVNTVAHYFFDRCWGRSAQMARLATWRSAAARLARAA